MNSLLSFIRRHGRGLTVLLALIVVLAAVRFSATAGAHDGVTSYPDLLPGKSTELVVILHGYASGADSMREVRDAVREVRPNADIVRFDYNRRRLSNANPFRIAEQVEEQIDQLQREHGYRKITLVGYSMGALIARKAYVYGCGSVADAPMAGSNGAVTRAPRDWVRHVDRFVLLAGMNRGWDLASGQATAWQQFGRYVGLTLARWTRTGELIRSAMRGEPFVANLRLQWLEVVRHADANQIPRPRVLQLLGDRDDLVSQDDSRDVAVARDFIWITVNNTDHAEMRDMGAGPTARERRTKFQRAFGDDAALEQLRQSNPKVELTEDRDVTTVVFVLHGIRDMGEWTSEFEAPLKDAFARGQPPGSKAKLLVYRASYGYFGMGPFLLPGDRQKNVRWFMDEVTELSARYPNLQDIHFIGHSNGTYVVASALQRYKALKLGRVVLAGSVVRRDYQWSSFTGRVKEVRNYVGADDWVVGLLPRVFELPGFDQINDDIGSAGFNGFEDGGVKPWETHYVRGGHGAALVPENVPSIVEFIANGKKADVAGVLVDRHPGWLALMSNLCWMLWILALALLVWGFWKSPAAGHWLAARFAFGRGLQVNTVRLVSRLGYVVGLWLVLLTV